VVVFPKGVEFLPWLMAGSLELGKATADGILKRDMVVWQFHGICARGRNLDETFGRIDVAEKAANICLKILSAGGAKQSLTDHQLRAIASNFNCIPDTDFLSEE
jgi:rhamnulose-1-phosphate aldolase